MNSLFMRSILNFIIHLSVIFLTPHISTAQTKGVKKTPKFLILIETTNEGVKLTSLEGCTWKELAFSLNRDNSQAIDQSGMTSLNETTTKNGNIYDFLFLIKRTQDGITIEGKNGTAWTSLSFGCPNGKCFQYIDFNGMTTKK